MSDFNALYAENCRLRLDLAEMRRELADAQQQAAQASARAGKQRAHLQHRVDSLIRKVRKQHALLNPGGGGPTRLWNCACGASSQVGNCRSCGTPRERGAVPVSERTRR